MLKNVRFREKPDPGPIFSGKFFSTKDAEFSDKFDGSIKFKIYRGYIWNFLRCQESHNNNNGVAVKTFANINFARSKKVSKHGRKFYLTKSCLI